ncbi:MAG: response regulator [Bacteroidales bacterium]|nr:response regulator [Bacteroidales bacterium]
MKTKILYVDDEPINLKLFEINFAKKYDVFVASNGFQGYELLNKELDVLIVISDMKMPEMTGIEFIRKAKEKFPDKKYYILTGYEINTEILEALNSGLIVKYFSKPFNIKEIEKTINDAINL